MKCHRYWPDAGVKEVILGPFSVSLLGEVVHSTYIERKIILRFKDKKKVCACMMVGAMDDNVIYSRGRITILLAFFIIFSKHASHFISTLPPALPSAHPPCRR